MFSLCSQCFRGGYYDIQLEKSPGGCEPLGFVFNNDFVERQFLILFAGPGDHDAVRRDDRITIFYAGSRDGYIDRRTDRIGIQ